MYKFSGGLAGLFQDLVKYLQVFLVNIFTSKSIDSMIQIEV